MRRILAGLAGTTALALTLAACGGGSDASSDDSSAGAGLKAELTWWDTADAKNEAPAFDALIEKFNEKYPDVKINHQTVPFDQAQNKFKTAAASGSGAPDILRAEVAWVPEFASLGYLYALDGTAPLEGNEFLETPLSSNEFDGKTYGVPQVTDTLGLMYNKKLFAAAGIEEAPTTWAEVADAAKKLKATGVEGIYLNAAGYFLLPFMYGEGGDLVDTEAKEIVVNSAENATGLQTAVDLVASGAAAKPNANESYDTMMTLFKGGKVGMIVNGPWEVANIDSDPAFGGFANLGVAPVPGGSAAAGAPVGGHNYVVYSGMDDKKAEAALAFVDFMSSAESQAFVADELGLLPANAEAYDQVADNEKVTAWKSALDVAVPRPWIPEGGQFFAPLDKLATQVLVEGVPAQKALDDVATTYKNEVVKDYAAQ